MHFLSWAGKYRGSYLVTIEWNGNKNKSKPLALLEKVFASTQEVFPLNLQNLWKI